jgi:transcription initiation factor TFIIH subunit 4
MLGSLELGQNYDSSDFSPTQKQLMADLYDLGIVYQRQPMSNRFYPTRLATTLTSDFNSSRSVGSSFDTAIQSSSAGEGFIIETNFRLYAYTSSPLQIAVLNLFTKLNTRFPNMVSGRLTRDSIRNAIAAGITSEQIIQYLSTHAHPQMRKNVPVLPPTVVDQIKLWQIEGERMKATDGFLFRDFASLAEYEALRTYAGELGVLVWKNDPKRLFFVSSMEKQVGGYLKIWKAQNER